MSLKLSEAGERFLRDIATRVPVDRVVEIHLFPALRQGPIESAVAIVAVASDEPSEVGEGAPRHVIYTATYRHTRKGPDRGAWSVEVQAQADAPLAIVTDVAKGVERRSDGAWVSAGGQAASVDAGGGGADGAVVLTGEELRAALGAAAAGTV